MQSRSSDLLAQTRLLDFHHPAIARLVAERGWVLLSERDRIGAIYNFVRDEIAFGYNASDELSASEVLNDGMGQCNTKGTLFMALLRAAGIACRFHGFTIDKELQKGAITGLPYLLAPRDIVHSWVEVWFGGRWVELEGFILDKQYLRALQQLFSSTEGPFCGYGVATPDLQSPPIEWKGENTYIQRDGINRDFGTFDDPDTFYEKHGSNLSGVKRWLYERVVRHWMNANVARIRQRAAPQSSARSALDARDAWRRLA